jgi:hypothetical protein
MWSKRSGSYASADGKTFTARFTTAYQVIHSAGDSEDTILFASGLPQVRDLYPGKSGVFCTSVRRDPVGPILSVVTAEWEGELGLSQDDSPINKAPKWSWTNSKTSEPVDTDAYGLPLCNSNGDLLSGFTKDVSDFTLTVVRNFQAINTYTLSQYLDSVNSDYWGSPDSIWPPGSAKLDTFNAENMLEGANQYYQVTAKIDFRIPYNTVPARAWWYRYRNEGLNVRTGTWVTITDSTGVGASAYPIVSSSGTISNVILTARGRNYTSPSVSIGTDTGGTGAVLGLTASFGQINSITVSSAGSGYSSKLVRAVDSNKEPVSQPVCLKADGTRLYDASAAVFIERPMKTYSLPYSALGLF